MGFDLASRFCRKNATIVRAIDVCEGTDKLFPPPAAYLFGHQPCMFEDVHILLNVLPGQR